MKSVITVILLIFQCLLPKGCYRTEPYSYEYVESYKCNFLGLHPSMHLPTHVNASEKFLLIDVFEPEDNGESPDSDPLGNYTFKFASPVSLDKGV